MKGTNGVASSSRMRRWAIFLILPVLCGAIYLTRPITQVDSQDIAAEDVAITQTFESGNLGTPGINYTFTNSAQISIPVGGPATPYPSVINVSNVPIQLAKVTVTLNNMNHEFASDVDILLVGPQGQTSVIMSDVGGASDIINSTILLDDDAPTVIPANGPIPSGTYRPTNSGLVDNFPAPAPAQTGGSVLSTFAGTNPNGEWKLFVFDDVGADAGNITGGWTLTLTAAISGQNTNSITIPDSGMASPYPSEIVVSNNVHPVSKVRVSLVNFTHSSPDDVDVLLAGPSGRTVVLMSDVGGSSALSNVTLNFDDTAISSLPDNGPITPGTYRPTDFEPGDVFPAPAPAGGRTGSLLSAFNGSVADGAWKLYVVDDSGNNVGSVSGGWNILVGSEEGAISFQGSASIASPYPSEVNVSGMPGNITKVTASIQNFSHTFPDDVDVLLVGPDGRRVVLMSDVGGGTEVGGLNLTFDDAAPSQIPDGGPMTSGSYKPTNFEPGEVYPDPAPSGPPTGNTLGAFFGGVPNGVWRLFIVNDGGNGVGSIVGNWSVTVQSSFSACLVTLNPEVIALPVAGGASGFQINQPNGCSWTASTTDNFVNITSPTAGSGNGGLTFSVGANTGPPRTGSIEISNGVGVRSFQIQQASGCPFSVAQSTVNFPYTGGSGSVTINAGAGCGWQGSTAASWIQITSQPQNGNGNLTFTVLPHPSRAARSATITVGVQTITVNQAGTRTAPFDFDGDRRTDVSVYRPSNGSWWIAASTAGIIAKQFGLSTDKTVAADYDGDLKTDIAVYRDGTWYAIRSSDNTISINSWGTSGDLPVPADYDADGLTEFAVYRPSSGTWWILNANGSYTSNGTATTDVFGTQGDVPVPADYDGDGRDNVALYRPSNSTWYRSTNPATNYDAAQWGLTGDVAAPGDYDGDGKVDPAVVRFGSSAVWYLLGSTSGPQAVQFGIAGDRAVPGGF